jgi:hypothetical protein
MKRRYGRRVYLAGRAALFIGLGIAGWAVTPGAHAATRPGPVPAQTARERLWIGGRYDGNRVIVYFDAVKFGNTVPRGVRIADPVADRLLSPIEVRAGYIGQFENEPGAERFALGDRYDVLSGGEAIEVEVTKLVGVEGDERVGNSSYIGAIATVAGECSLHGTKEYYAVRRHREPVCGSKPAPGHPIRWQTETAGLVNEPVGFDIQKDIVSLLARRMILMAPGAKRRAAQRRSPEVRVQAFRVAGGGIRYYATARWRSGTKRARSDFSLGAWLASAPAVRILAVEANQNAALPEILNVADLGGGRTGVILAEDGEDSISTDLVEYQDGLNARQMRLLQSITARE